MDNHDLGSGASTYTNVTTEPKKAYRTPDYNKVPFGDKISDGGAEFIRKQIFNAAGATVEVPKRGLSIMQTVKAALHLRP